MTLNLLKQIRNRQKKIKERSPQELPLKEVSWSESAPTLIDKKPTKRLMVIAISKGCEWAKKDSGPCTMCNFWYACSEKATTNKIIDYFKKEINKYDFKKEGIEEVDIFNSGSFFNNREMPEQARLELIRVVSKIKQIKKVMVESRPEYISEKKIKNIKKVLGTKELEIAIGLESSDNFVRDVLINKGFNLEAFEKAAKIIKKSGATLFVYALVKPPFLSEKEAIKDAVKTIKYSFELGKKLNLKTKIALEPVFIKPNTLIYKLYKKNKYSHVWLWSMIEILKQTFSLGHIQVGLSSEGMKWNEMPRNCKKCTPKIIKLLNEYNLVQNVKIFNNLNCECEEDWNKEIKKKSIPLRKRVKNYFNIK